MLNYKEKYIVLVCCMLLLIYIIYLSSKDKNIENWTDGKLIITRDDGIKHLMNIVDGNMIEKDATELYDKLFDQTDLNITIAELFNRYDHLKKNIEYAENNKYYQKTYLAVADIINEGGINKGLPWLDNNAINVINLAAMKKERLRDIYRFDPNDDVDFRTIFGKVSNNYYINCDFIDIIRFNRFNSSINLIINRHPILNAYKQQILNLLKEKLIDKYGNNVSNENYFNLSKKDFSQHVTLSLESIINKIVPNKGDEIYKQAISNSIYNTIFVNYDKNMSVNNLLNNAIFSNDKINLSNGLINVLNNFTLYVSPNHDYSDQLNKENLLNGSLEQLNNILFNIRFYKDLSYMRNNLWQETKTGDILMENSNKVPILTRSQTIDILNIFYQNYDGIMEPSIISISNIVHKIREQNEGNIVPLTNNLNDRLNYIIQYSQYLMFDEIFTSSNIVECNNIPIILKHVRTLIKKNYPDTPYDLIMYRINRYSKIKDISEALIFGLY